MKLLRNAMMSVVLLGALTACANDAVGPEARTQPAGASYDHDGLYHGQCPYNGPGVQDPAFECP
ncbi:MAG: hypothetical protein KY467_07360 [Gemmatimonadetes bacterium]|nr:hypothetical protein [Gemmatimonadota bacterium]